MSLLPQICPVCHDKSLDINNDFTVSCTNCQIFNTNLRFWQIPIFWAKGKWWWWRLPILIWFGVMLIQNWHNTWFAANRTSNPFSAFDLGIHELGHILFLPFGTFLHIAGGSLFQCIFPIIGIFAFWQIRWYFASIMCLPWLGLNLFDVGMYAGDAISRLLPLSAGFAGLTDQGNDKAYDQAHDWYQILSRLHHLNWDHRIEHILRVAATFVTILGLVLGSLLLAYMLTNSLQKFLHKQNNV